MLSRARAHNLSNLMGDPILSSGLFLIAGMRATGSNTPAGPAAERPPRTLSAKGVHLERLLSTNSSRASASKGFLIRLRAPAESASASR
jgi:hypothetical protein